MPRDTSSLLEATPDLTTPSLEGLAYLLRHRELWPEGFVWDYRQCETCAIGVAASLWYRKKVYKYADRVWAEKAFKISYVVAGRLFVRVRARSDGLMSEVTPEHVATAIEQYLAGR